MLTRNEPKAQEKTKKPPIPQDVSGVAYETIEGFVKYCTTGKNRELPKDFKKFLNFPKRK